MAQLTVSPSVYPAAIVSDAPAASVRASEALVPAWVEISLCIAALLIYAIAGGYGGAFTDLANLCGPALLSIGVGFGLLTMTSRNINTIWTPLFWYRLALIAYCGIGSLVPLFANDDTRALMEGFFLYFPDDLLKYNAIVCLFHVGIMVFVRALLNVVHIFMTVRGNADSRFIAPSNFSLKFLGFTFLALGASINYLVTYPTALGITTIILPNFVYQLAQASLIGYFMVTYWALSTQSRWIYFVILLAAIDSFMGMIQFTKFVTIFPWLMIGVAFIYHKANWVRIITFFSLIVPFYFAITPVVSYGRSALASTYGLGGQPTFSEALEILTSYDSETRKLERNGEIQGGWARLSYVNSGTFAISQYDTGLPGNSLRNIFIIWIPRLIYPDKPIVTDLSREFNFSVNGNYNSASNPGIPIEGYWTAGWLGTGLFSLLMGLVLTTWSIYTMYVLERQAWHLFYVVLLGLRVGARLDGMLVVDVIGPVGTAVIGHIILQILNRFLPSRIFLEK